MSRVARTIHHDHDGIGLAYAEIALADAERFNCGNDEILALCDEVIHRRLKLRMRQLADGGWPTTAVRTQMIRDRLLLNEAHTPDRIIRLL